MSLLAPLNSKRFRLRIFFPLLAYLPRSLAYWVATWVGQRDAIDPHSPVYGELQAIRKLIQQAMPEITEERLDESIRTFTVLGARDALDGSSMHRLTQDVLGSFIYVEGLDHLHAARANGSGVILLVAHYGRLCMIGPALGLSGSSFCFLSERVDTAAKDSDGLDSLFARRKLRKLHAFAGEDWITSGRSLRKVYRALGAGKTLLLTLDGFWTRSLERMEYPFLAGVISLPVNIARVADATGARMVFATVTDNIDNAGVTVCIRPLPRSEDEAMQSAVAILEADVKASPGHWGMWLALHAIWSPTEGLRADNPSSGSCQTENAATE